MVKPGDVSVKRPPKIVNTVSPPLRSAELENPLQESLKIDSRMDFEELGLPSVR